MSRKEINVGTSANKGDGDPLRTAFKKINENFAELYTGNFAEPDVITSTVAPDTDGAYDLGKIDKRWTDLYVKDYIYLNGSRIELSSNGTLLINGGPPTERQDTVGSVFGDDSTLLVDGVNSNIPKANIEDSANWDTAFGWGNHASAGYADGTNEANWDTAHGWGNHASAGYADGTNEANWDTAFAWGDHSAAGYADGTNEANWDTAFSWGDHAAAGYLTSETDSQTLSLVGTDLSITNGNTVDLSGFLTSYTETDPVVGAITGIVKADGAGNISAAVAGTDYLVAETIDLATLKTEVAAAIDFADFQTRIAAL
jgi:hypothetical protein